MDRAELAKAQREIIESEVTGDYFYTRRGYLVFKNGRYVPIDKSSLRLRLSRVLGNQPDTVNDAILAIEDSKFVSYCGPLAGCDRGLHETADGEKILATNGPKIIPSWEGDWTEIKSFLSALFADDTFDQLAYFYSWLQSARLAMLARKPSPGQLLALVGPRACGKTQLVQRLIKPSMGGREANPVSFFSGERFNGDLVKAELLVMDDETLPTDARSRQTFKQRVKTFLYSGAPRIEAKGQDAFTFQGLWRAVVCCNEAEDDLRALPPVDSGTEDKLIYLRCSPALDPRTEAEDFEHWCGTIRQQIPAFLHFVENYEVPERLRGGRGNVSGWQHPVLLDEMDRSQGWRALLEIVDSSALFLPWKGTARELESSLENDDKARLHSRKLFGSWVNKAGALLGEAAAKTERVYKAGVVKGTQAWCITSPEQED